LTSATITGMLQWVRRAVYLAVLALPLACERGELLGRLSGAVGQGGGAGVGGNPEGGAAPDPVGPLFDPVARDTDPTFTGDLTELYFMTTRTSSKDIWKSTRADAASEWGTPTPVPELSSGYQEENARVSADGLRLWFFTDRDRAQGTIWEVTRETRTDPWSPVAPVQGLSVGAGSSAVSAGMNATATLAVLSARQSGSGGYDLYRFERASVDEPFGEPTPFSELNSASDDFDPYLSPNGLAIAFASNRRGGFDIFLARRTSVDVEFEAPVPLDLNTSEYEESAPHFSADLAYLMYSSDRLGSLDIYDAVLFP
jgi:Tol biopolymer transport system component